MLLREKIINESLKLFSLNGYENTGINNILEAANTSKGGFYHHFASKEDLFFHVLAEAQRIWRERSLFGLDKINSPIGKIEKLLENYRDRYLIDSENFPGGCVFITFSVELDDQNPHLSGEVNKGIIGLKRMLNRLLEEGKEMGELKKEVKTGDAAEMITNGILGASVIYGVDKSPIGLERSIHGLINYLDLLKP